MLGHPFSLQHSTVHLVLLAGQPEAGVGTWLVQVDGL